MRDIPIFDKTPDERLDYSVDWSAWLLGGDTIAGAPVWTVPVGIALDSQIHDAARATAWLTGGIVGRTYTVECRVTTAQGRIAERALVVRCVDRR